MWINETDLRKCLSEYLRDKYSDLSEKIIGDVSFKIKSLILEAFEDIFAMPGDRKKTNLNWDFFKLDVIKITIKCFIKEYFDENYKAKADEFIQSEEFIDKIIDRINRKQLNTK